MEREIEEKVKLRRGVRKNVNRRELIGRLVKTDKINRTNF